VLEAREESAFTGLFDFCERVDARRLNRRVIEALIKAGGFDGVALAQQVNRAQLMAALDMAQERAAAAQRDRESGQTSMLDLLGQSPASAQQSAVEQGGDEQYPDVPDWPPRTRLNFERENLGFFVSGHPLDRYRDDLRRYATATTAQLRELADRTEVTVGGIVADYRERPLKSGKGRIAIFNLEDLEGQVEVVCFSRAFEEFEQVLKSDEPLLVVARLKYEGEGEDLVPRLQLQSAATLEQSRSQKTKEVHLHLAADTVEQQQIGALKELLRQHVGDCKTYIHLALPKRSTTTLELSERYAVDPTDNLLLALERLFGEPVATLR
jgi:DNA polymerase-3 subunit alpha